MTQIREATNNLTAKFRVNLVKMWNEDNSLCLFVFVFCVFIQLKLLFESQAVVDMCHRHVYRKLSTSRKLLHMDEIVNKLSLKLHETSK